MENKRMKIHRHSAQMEMNVECQRYSVRKEQEKKKPKKGVDKTLVRTVARLELINSIFLVNVMISEAARAIFPEWIGQWVGGALH